MMGEITKRLFEQLTEDARARPDEDVHRNNRKPRHGFTQEGLAFNDDFKDYLFEIIMRRARDFVDATCQESKSDPKERFALVNISLLITDGTLHPESTPSPVIEGILKGHAVVFPDRVDSEATSERLEAINPKLLLACGPPE